jgi:hypothetical protein
MDTNERGAITVPDVLTQLFGAPFRLRTYTNLLYLMLAFPLGLAYFVFLAVGLAAGFGLTLVWIGIPLLALVFAGSWAFATFERQMAIHLLGAEVPPMIPLIVPAPNGEARTALQRAGDFFGNPSTWKGMGFLLIKFPLGIVSFGAVVTLLATSSAFLLAPVAWSWGVLDIDVEGLGFRVDSLGGAWGCALLGLGMLFLSLNLLNALALIWRGTASLLLGSDRLAAAAPPPALSDAVPGAIAA